MTVWVPNNISNLLLYNATGLLILGIIVWLEFVRVARPVLTLLLAAAGAACGYVLPLFWHTQLAGLTLIIIGMVLGILLGAILFRLTQAILFGMLMALLCGGLVAWHDGAFVTHASKSPSMIAPQGGHHAPPVAEALSAGSVTTRSMPRREHLAREIRNRFNRAAADFGRLDASQKSQVLAAAAAGLLVAILLGLLYPRATSVIGGAWLGAGMILWAVAVFTRRFDPGMLKIILHNVRPIWIYAGLGILGMAIQGRHMLQARKKKKEAKDEKSKKKK